MSRLLRWGIGLSLIAGLLLGAFFFLPFHSWLPGGTVADIPTREVVNGTRFNRLFPTPQADEQLVFTQEKRGFSQARLKRGAEVTALLSISDVANAPASRDKFASAAERLRNWPLVEQGSQASALLVADRFQVKVIGQGAGLDVEQRHGLLGAFNLEGLAALNPQAALAPTRSRPSLPQGSTEAVRPPVSVSPQRVPQPAAEPTAATLPHRATAVLESAA